VLIRRLSRTREGATTVGFSQADPRISLPATPRSARLLERDTELEAIGTAFAHAVRGTGGLVLVEGPAGVGKTALMDAAHAGAEDAGLRVLRARGAELERAFGYGVVRQLFEPILRPERFTGAARLAAPVLGLELDTAASDDPFAARHALYWLTANLAAEQPLALLVDDAHWADAASMGTLAHLANRLQGIGVALVVAGRVEESSPALDALRAHAPYPLLVPPLGESAAAAVVRSLAPAADDALCHACHAATGGNPFLLRELARALGADGGLDTALVQSLLAGEGVAPERVTREIGVRLTRLGDAAGRLARAAAVLGAGITLRRAAALAELGETTATAAADALIAGGVLRSAHPVEFLHPLIGAAVYAGVSPAARSREHGRAARLLAQEAESPERVAAQLLRCPPSGDLWAFEQLTAAARLAGAGGAADAVATYLRRALDEPAPPEHRADVLLALGRAESNFDPAAAVAHLREVLEGEVEVEGRFAATMLLSGVLGQTGQAGEAADVLERQFAAFAGRPDLRGTAEAALANVTRIDPTTRRRADDVIARMRARVRAGERDPVVLGAISAELGMAGEPADEVAAIAEPAVVDIDASTTTAAGWSWYNAVRSLVVAERYDVARRALDLALERHRERGALLDVGGVLIFRAELFLQLGELANAEVDARSLHEIASVYGWPLGLGMAIAALGEVLIERGELAEAEETLFEGPYAGPAATLPHVYMSIWVLRVRGLLRIAQQRPEDAVVELRESGRRALDVDHVNPAVLPWRSQLALVLAALGELDEAHRLSADELTRARRFGGARALGIALVAAGRIASDTGLLRDAVTTLDASEAVLETARAHLALGSALRAQDDTEGARDALRRAIDLAHRCGGRALEDAALAELRATGARPRRRRTTGAGALTPSERRIAQLAAGGRQNREIAEALFVTTATVEYHLRNAYRKLEITSRTQLTAAL
jgi:DNA-binding CsgD family transcriptional regulator